MYQVGQRTGDYEVLEVLGSGAMGKVYKVRNVISDRVEAMKVLLPNLEGQQELGERFLREIKVQATLQHKNIAQLHTAQRDGHKMLMLIEYVDGITLETALERVRISTELTVNIVLQVLEALAYAHSRNVIHRDIKPANIMCTRDGVAKLMDFGIARLSGGSGPSATKEGRTVGSLYYMSPEQIRGATDLDSRSDYYSLGIMMYEMVTGQRPFEGDSEYSIMIGHLQTPPRPPVEVDPRVPAVLNDIILQAIQKDRDHRFQTADAFARALRGAFGLPSAARTAAESTSLYDSMRVDAMGAPATPPVPASPPAITPMHATPAPSAPMYMPPPPPPARQSSGKGLLIATALLGVTAVSGGGFWYWKSTHPKDELYVRHEPAGEPGRPAATMPSAEQYTPPAATEAKQPAPAPVEVAAHTPPVASQPQDTMKQRSIDRSSRPTPAESQPPVQVAAQPPPAAPAEPQPQPATAARPQADPKLEDLRKRYNEMSVRFSTAKEGVATLEAQMRSQGLGMRSDIKQLVTRGDYLMKESMDSIRAGNATAAEETLDQAARVIDSLKRFLNQ